MVLVVGYANQSHSFVKQGIGRWSEQETYHSDFGRMLHFSIDERKKPGNLAASGFCVICLEQISDY